MAIYRPKTNFRQNNAQVHAAKKHTGTKLTRSESPDLIIIENLRLLLKRKRTSR